MKVILLILILFCLFGCDSNKHHKEIVPSETKIKDTVQNSTTPALDTGTFSIQLGSTTLSLQQWDSTFNLEKELDKPLKQKTKQLDQNSDTHSGSYIRDIEYKGMKLKFFSPKQNGRTFWVQEIIITDPKYKTTKGITIGDDLEKVKLAYPALKKFPGENENMYLVADDRYEKSIEMEFDKNRLTKLRMYYMMP